MRGLPQMDWRAVAMGLAFAWMWSSAFTSMRIVALDGPPLATLAARFWVSGLLAVVIAKAMGQNWQFSRTQWKGIITFGVLQNVVYLGLTFTAGRWLEASVSTIIASTMPLWVAFFGCLGFGERLRPLGYLGLVVGVIGVAIMMSGRFAAGLDLFGVALMGVGVLALTFATLTLKNVASKGHLLMSVGMQMLVGAALLTVVAVVVPEPELRFSWRYGLAFAWMVVVPGLLASWVWFALVERIGAVPAAAFHFLNPVFGVAVAAALLGEAVTLRDLIGVVIVAFAILAVQMSRIPKEQ